MNRQSEEKSGLCPVQWHTGMSLQAVHFQMDASYRAEAWQALKRLWGSHCWGLWSFASDDALLAQNRYQLISAEGYWCTGEAWRYQSSDYETQVMVLTQTVETIYIGLMREAVTSPPGYSPVITQQIIGRQTRRCVDQYDASIAHDVLLSCPHFQVSLNADDFDPPYVMAVEQLKKLPQGGYVSVQHFVPPVCVLSASVVLQRWVRQIQAQLHLLCLQAVRRSAKGVVDYSQQHYYLRWQTQWAGIVPHTHPACIWQYMQQMLREWAYLHQQPVSSEMPVYDHARCGEFLKEAYQSVLRVLCIPARSEKSLTVSAIAPKTYVVDVAEWRLHPEAIVLQIKPAADMTQAQVSTWVSQILAAPADIFDACLQQSLGGLLWSAQTMQSGAWRWHLQLTDTAKQQLQTQSLQLWVPDALTDWSLLLGAT